MQERFIPLVEREGRKREKCVRRTLVVHKFVIAIEISKYVVAMILVFSSRKVPLKTFGFLQQALNPSSAPP